VRAVPDGAVEQPATTEFFTNLYRAAAERYDAEVEPDDPLTERLGEAAGERSAAVGVEFRDGPQRAFAFAHDHYRVALVTDGRPETRPPKLRQSGIADEFDRVPCCHPGGACPSKPAPEPFEWTRSDFGIAPGTCVVVGDSRPADVVGAHGAGLRSVWTPANRPHEEPPGDPEPAPTRRTEATARLPGGLRETDDR
jgi:putative hydrolase of the HAD superfamily